MIRTAAISPEHRANLRHLRSSFEAAYDAVDDSSDRSSPEYIEADRRYRVWISAMDAVAIALLDDIDSLEATMNVDGSSQVDPVPHTRTMPEMSDRADVFCDAVDFQSAREFIGTPEESDEEHDLYDRP